MLVTVETQNKKCIVETEYWYAWKDDIKEDLIEMSFTEEEFTELPDKLTLTTSDVYRWGHITVDMPYEDYEQWIGKATTNGMQLIIAEKIGVSQIALETTMILILR